MNDLQKVAKETKNNNHYKFNPQLAAVAAAGYCDFPWKCTATLPYIFPSSFV